MDERSDDELVAQALRGDQDAAETIVRRHARRIGGYLFRLTGSVHESQDLMQETFARFFGAIADYRPEGKLGAYLYRIAGNLAAHERDRKRRSPGVLDEQALDPAPGPETRAIDRHHARALAGALATLGRDQREALLLKVNEGLSYEDIARIQDTSVSAVKVRVFRAREALRQRMELPARGEATP